MTGESWDALDVTLRRVPGFVWVRLVVLPLSWRRGSWWAVRGIVRTHALGPLRLLTMRDRSPVESLRLYREAE